MDKAALLHPCGLVQTDFILSPDQMLLYALLVNVKHLT